MTMPVSPGGAYFGFYSDFGDVNRGEIISYADAVASAAAPNARDVGDLVVPDDIGSPTILSGHPKILTFNGDSLFLGVSMTYDNGYWDDSPGVPFVASNFLVELQGPSAGDVTLEIGGGDLQIAHYVSSDGGQSIYLDAYSGTLVPGITRIKIWRAEVFPGDPLPNPTNFWTSFVDSREII